METESKHQQIHINLKMTRKSLTFFAVIVGANVVGGKMARKYHVQENCKVQEDRRMQIAKFTYEF